MLQPGAELVHRPRVEHRGWRRVLARHVSEAPRDVAAGRHLGLLQRVRPHARLGPVCRRLRADERGADQQPDAAASRRRLAVRRGAAWLRLARYANGQDGRRRRAQLLDARVRHGELCGTGAVHPGAPLAAVMIRRLHARSAAAGYSVSRSRAHAHRACVTRCLCGRRRAAARVLRAARARRERPAHSRPGHRHGAPDGRELGRDSDGAHLSRGHWRVAASEDEAAVGGRSHRAIDGAARIPPGRRWRSARGGARFRCPEHEPAAGQQREQPPVVRGRQLRRRRPVPSARGRAEAVQDGRIQHECGGRRCLMGAAGGWLRHVRAGVLVAA
eukprot:7384767-Prymnesium_polylepis.1